MEKNSQSDNRDELHYTSLFIKQASSKIKKGYSNMMDNIILQLQMKKEEKIQEGQTKILEGQILWYCVIGDSNQRSIIEDIAY